MALDLSLLEESPIHHAASPSHGKPLDVPIGDIEEDPEQPRTEFSEESLQEMVISIQAKGKILSPISLRPHPARQGKWLLNHGARRLRGSLLAGLSTIPAFIDELHDNYDQVIENLHRENLSPMELALFIKKRVDLGDKQKAIAKRLGKAAPLITYHLALLNLPDCIDLIYQSGQCRSPKTLYELKGLYEKNPDVVSKWCAEAQEITRQSVAKLADTIDLACKQAFSPPIDPIAMVKLSPHSDEAHSNTALTEQTPSLIGLPIVTGKQEKTRKGGRPVLMIGFNERTAIVLLDTPPSAPGLIHIRYEDGLGDDEIQVDSCRILSLTHA